MTKIQGSIEEKKQRMTELVDLLNQAGRAYYQGSAGDHEQL